MADLIITRRTKVERIARLLGAFSFFVLSFVVHAADPWTQRQVAQQIAYTALLAVDWKQTRAIGDSCTTYPAAQYDNTARKWVDVQDCKWSEVGLARPFIGEHPSAGKINLYFAASGLLNLAVANYLPSKWRNKWQGASIIFQTATDLHNYNMGISIKF